LAGASEQGGSDFHLNSDSATLALLVSILLTASFKPLRLI